MDKITEILNDLQYKFYTNKVESKFQKVEDKKNEKSIAQVRTAIKEYFKGLLLSEKEIESILANIFIKNHPRKEKAQAIHRRQEEKL